MGPSRKRQRLSEDGTAAITATTDAEQPSNPPEATTVDDEQPRKNNLKQRRSLFVRSLAPSVTTENLSELFSESYPIKHALAVLDSTTQQCKGYGFVTFADAEDAQRAMEELNGSTLQGKKIRIEFAESRHRDVDAEEATGRKRSIPAAAAVKAKADREQGFKDQQAPKLIIRNLPWSIRTPEQLTLLFRSYGKVKFANLPKKPSGELQGFGFVLLRGKKNSEKALKEVNGKEVDGRTLAVDWAVERDAWQSLQKEGQDGAEDEDTAMQDNVTLADEDAESILSDQDDENEDEDEDEGDSNTDYEDISDDEEGGVELDPEPQQRQSDSRTLFIRNLPFSASDESLQEHFEQFGKIRYARIVMDHETERPRGTGFVAFVTEEDALECLKGVPRVTLTKKTTEKKDGSSITVTHSVLENEDEDPTGRYTMDGRILAISLAVDRNEANRLTVEHAATRFNRDKDKRRLYLLSEGTIPRGSPLFEKLSPSEVTMREASAKQRQKLIQSNPSLHLSLTRLSIRNIPRSITSKDLKALARQAIVGFASDVKAGKRSKLSKEELARGGDAMAIAEKMRKRGGKGIVKQAKIVFETPEGGKVAEGTGAGRSRGYGFIEYYTHRSALMGLRWLNGHAVDYRVKNDNQPKSKKASQEAMEDRKKRLVVEFAIENANVVHRRSDREVQSRDTTKPKAEGDAESASAASKHQGRDWGKKRKRDEDTRDVAGGEKGSKGRGRGRDQGTGAESVDGATAGTKEAKKDKDAAKLASRSRIIQQKRMARRARKTGR
ncbi:hypothetical protein B0J11DRAFT_118918 [Dendryphion nanum]|uniref:RRM domain-containing protein n=1 Tax=Dendryphion nanum TaxID=256645 RepID=A0A9P9DBD5_9PLEO|nr:hypothetical protein B0J11DRAFT_118918 [Dendryphion nanum]